MQTNFNPGNTATPSFLQALQLFIIDRPWFCIVFSLMLVALAGYGLKFAQINNDPRAMFTAENEGLIFLEELEARFSKDENILFIIHPKNNNIFTQDALSAIAEITEAGWTLPRAQRVDSLINYQHTEAVGDELNVRYLVENPEQLTDYEIQTIQQIALNEPYLVKNVISSQGHVASVNVTVMTNEAGGRDAPVIMAAAVEIRDKLRNKYPDINFMLSGQVAFDSASQDTTTNELTTTSIYSSVAILLCLYLILRSVVSVILTLIIITLSNVFAMGMIVWLGVEVGPVMAGAPAIILTLAVADSIHLLVTYQQNITAGLAKREAMLESLRINMQPVFLTSITTAVGFLFLNSSKSPPFADMANMVSIGVMAALFLSLVLLPAMIMVLPQQKYRRKKTDSESNYKHPWLDAFAGFVIRYRLPVFICSSTIFVTLALCATKNEFNDVWLEYFDETYEVRVATDFLVDELTGHHRLQFGFPSKGTAGIMEPEYMEGVEKFAQWARQQEGVDFVSSFSDTIKRLNRDMNGGDPAFYRIPEQRELISQYTLMYQLSLPFGLGLENQIDMDQSTVRVNVLIGKISSNDIMAFELKARQWIEENLPSYMHTRGVGFDLLLGELSHENGQGMLVGTALALVVVSMLLVISLRSFKYGLMSMFPNLFPALISFGIWGLIDGQIGISVSIVACMTLGIVIDNTVHFLSKYTRAKAEQGFSTIEACRYAFNTVGVALFATTLVLASNFGMMALSHYYPNASMGLLTAITVVIALAVNFFFFVPLLLFLDRDPPSSSSAEIKPQESIEGTCVQAT